MFIISYLLLVNSIKDKMKNYSAIYNSPESREKKLQTVPTELILDLESDHNTTNTNNYNNNNDYNRTTNTLNGSHVSLIRPDSRSSQNPHNNTTNSNNNHTISSNDLNTTNNTNINAINNNHNNTLNDDDEKAIETEAFLLYTSLQTKVLEYEESKNNNKRLHDLLNKKEFDLNKLNRSHGNKTKILESTLKSTNEEITKVQTEYNKKLAIVETLSNSFISLYKLVCNYYLLELRFMV